MNETTAIIPAEPMRLGSLSVSSPDDVVARATGVAKTLADVIRQGHLARKISGREFVQVEGWTTLGAMLGITPREVSVALITEPETAYEAYEATVELVRVSDGAIIGRASALCGNDEQTWRSRPRFARRSMAVTRATGKAFRLSFSWVMVLAGYEPTPAEEMTEREEEAIDAPARPVSKPTLDALKAELAAVGNEAKAQHAIASERGKAVLASKLLTAIEDARAVFAKNGKATAAEIETATANLRALIAEAKAQPEAPIA